jgi:3-oxoacyl-[acyl-carrier-protein] synthase III
MVSVNKAAGPYVGTRVRLAGIAYELGEEERSYRDLEGMAEAIRRFRMIDDAALWGWGGYRKTRREASQLAVASARKTLESAGLAPDEVDMVILCSTSFPTGTGVHLGYCNVVLGELGLFGAFSFGMTLNRCGTMLTALRLAAEMTAAGRAENALVISTDVVSDELGRFQPYAIFSDAASSCVVTASDRAGYDVVHAIHASVAASMDDTGADLAATSARGICRALGETLPAIHKVFPDNLFLPIVCMREQMAGFSRRQLFLDNVTAVGHCFSSDSLINLATQTGDTALPPRSLVALFSSTPGLRTGLVLRTGASAPASAQRPSTEIREN